MAFDPRPESVRGTISVSKKQRDADQVQAGTLLDKGHPRQHPRVDVASEKALY
jgi:hypothetical protein